MNNNKYYHVKVADHISIYDSIFMIFADEDVRGVNDLWTSVNHIAIVVSDVGTSLSFYTQVVGMTQIFRPNFDRCVCFIYLLALNFVV